MQFFGDSVSLEPVSRRNPLPVTTNGRSIPAWDHRSYTYVGESQDFASAVYRLGGPSGAIVATQTFAYDAQGRLIGESWT
jgi:hypothetical protein